VWAWIFTVPASAALAASAALLVKAGPLALTLVVLILGAAVLALLARRTRRKQPIIDDFGIGDDPSAAGKEPMEETRGDAKVW
jgi:membrane protein implicated in regulation of membrane protease activity